MAIALIVFGGGSDESLADEAEGVCREANDDVIASQSVLPVPATAEQTVSWLRAVYVDLQRERVAALRDLGTDDELTELVDAHEAAVDRIAADPAQFLDADPFADLNPRWEEFGAPSCGGLISE